MLLHIKRLGHFADRPERRCGFLEREDAFCDESETRPAISACPETDWTFGEVCTSSCCMDLKEEDRVGWAVIIFCLSFLLNYLILFLELRPASLPAGPG